MLNFLLSRLASKEGNVSELQSACSGSSPSDLQHLILRQEQCLLDTCAQNPNIEVAISYLSHLRPSTVYKELNIRRYGPLTPAQYLLERAARHSNAALVRHLLANYPDLDLCSQMLGAHALNGDVEIWQALLEKKPNLKNVHYGHSGSIVEYCVLRGRADVLRYLLEQGAKVEDEGRPILHCAEICESSEEIRGILRDFGADPTQRMED